VGRGDSVRPDPRIREARAAQHARVPGAVLTQAAPLWPAAPGARRLDALGIGQISLDRLWVGDAPFGGEPPDGLPARPGGQVATAVLALARLGLRAAWLGAVGADPEAEAALAPLRAAGVDCSRVKRMPGGRTRRALIRIDRATGEREVIPERDPAVALGAADVDPAQVADAKLLLVDAEDAPASLCAARLAHPLGVAVVLDVDRVAPGADALLAEADFPIVSRAFAESYGSGSVRDGLRAVARRARRLAVVTLGPEGSVALARDGEHEVSTPAFAVAVRDTTGAGDAFHAGFAFGLLQELPVSGVLRVAHAVAALNCRQLGAQAGLPDRAALEAFLAERAARA
jgi:sugar/nucleoside kinase (ribokinase family)